MNDEQLKDAKKQALRRGQYAFKAPPGPAWGWTENDWITWIDNNGVWLPQRLNTGGSKK